MKAQIVLLTLAVLLPVGSGWGQTNEHLRCVVIQDADGLRDERFIRDTNSVLHVITTRDKSITVLPVGDQQVILEDAGSDGTIETITVSRYDTNGIPAEVVEVYERKTKGGFAPVQDEDLKKRKQAAIEGSAQMKQMIQQMRGMSTNRYTHPGGREHPK